MKKQMIGSCFCNVLDRLNLEATIEVVNKCFGSLENFCNAVVETRDFDKLSEVILNIRDIQIAKSILRNPEISEKLKQHWIDNPYRILKLLKSANNLKEFIYAQRLLQQLFGSFEEFINQQDHNFNYQLGSFILESQNLPLVNSILKNPEISGKLKDSFVTSPESLLYYPSNNAQLIIPGVMTTGNPFLKSNNTYQSQLICRWNLNRLSLRLTCDYSYINRPYSLYYTQQEMMGMTYIVGKRENANYSSDLGGTYQLSFSPFKNKVLTVTLQGNVYQQTISSPIIGRYRHVWTPLYFDVQFLKGAWGLVYQGNIVSKRLSGSTLDAGENASHLQLFWKKKYWKIYAACLWLFTTARYASSSQPTSILQRTSKRRIDDNRSMFVIGFSFDFSTGKKLNINRKLHNADTDKGTF